MVSKEVLDYEGGVKIKSLLLNRWVRKYEREKRRVHVGFMNLEKAYNRINRELNGKCWKCMMCVAIFVMELRVYINSVACLWVKAGESECFRIDSGKRHGCNMSPCIFNVYMDKMIREVKVEMERRVESRECLALCMHMSSFYVASRRKT